MGESAQECKSQASVSALHWYKTKFSHTSVNPISTMHLWVGLQ